MRYVRVVLALVLAFGLTALYSSGFQEGASASSLLAGDGQPRSGLSASPRTVGSDAPPVAGFSASITSGFSPLDVAFTDASTGTIDTWLWDFGDGGTGAVQNVSHVYASGGSYTVTLTVSGPAGTDTLTQPNYIAVQDPVIDLFAGVALNDGAFCSGGVFNYTVSYGNTSASAAPNVVLTDTLPMSVTLVSSSGSVTPTLTGNQLVWGLGTVAAAGSPGSQGAISVTVRLDLGVPAGTVIANAVAVSSSDPETTYANNTATNTIVIPVPSCNMGASGYYMIDSNTGGGPAYGWIDATTGTKSSLAGDDSSAGSFPIGFTFPYYGNTYTSLYFSTNGIITFGGGNNSYSNTGLPNTGAPRNMLAPFWDDLYVTSPQGIYYKQGGTAPNRYFVVEWYTIAEYYNRGAVLTFEVVLNENGTVVFQYNTINESGHSATIGIQDSAGTSGLAYDVNTGKAAPGLAVAFIPIFAPIATFSGAPTSGLAPLAVTFANNTLGSYDTSSWDFGDGVTSTVKSPIHTYNDPGVYTVGLSVGGAAGSSVLTRTNYITAESPFVDLYVGKGFDGGDLCTGGILTYTITYKNNGNIPATGVILTDTLPMSTTFLSATGPISPTVGGGQVVWSLGGLAAKGLSGYQGSISISVRLADQLPLGFVADNNVEIGASETDANPSNNAATNTVVIPIPVCSQGSFNYDMKDSNMPDGPAFGWIDATDGANANLFGDEAYGGPYPLGFGFWYYGQMYNQVYFNTNGWATFTGGTSGYTNMSIPNTNAPNNLLAAFYDDLQVTNPEAIFYKQGGTAPNRYFVIEWHNIGRWADGGTHLTFEAVIYENGKVLFQYNSMVGTLNSASIGIENRTGTDGLQYDFNQGKARSGLAVAFTPSLEPNSRFTGTPLSGATPLVVTFTNQSIGVYDTSVWDFGDGITTTATSPVHTYASAGAYTVTLTTSSVYGTSTLERPSYVTANNAPILGPISDVTIDEGAPYTVTVTANDVDLPGQVLTFGLVGWAYGASIDPATGVFGWTPGESQGPGVYAITARVTDNGFPNLSDSRTFTVTVNEVNRPPVLGVTDQWANEMALFSYHIVATDPDIPANVLTYTVDVSGAPGATYDPGTGYVTWTPTEAQGPGAYVITATVTDDGLPNLSDTRAFTINVREVNIRPTLDPIIGDVTIDEGMPITFTATASDPDMPANGLSFSLDYPHGGATIGSGTGYFSWTPSEAEGPGVYPITVRVSDNGYPILSDARTFTVTVNEVNRPPVLHVTNQVIDEMAPFNYHIVATDPDLPANTLTYGLDTGTALGVSFDTGTAILTWTPTETQGPGTYVFTATVTDNGVPAMSDTGTFTITVREVNTRPTVGPISDVAVDEGTPITFTVTATDTDIPVNQITFSLDNPPGGASIHPNTGLFTWTPSEAQGPGVYSIVARSTDNGIPPLSGTRSFTVTVNEVNQPPVLASIGNKSANEGYLLSFAATATDPDLPANVLTYSLDAGGASGATIGSSNGVFNWTPSSAQAGATYPMTVTVTDSGSPSLSDTKSFSVTVNTVGPAVLQLSRTVFDFFATAGGSNPADQQLQVNNTGGAILNWSSTAWTQNGVNWLSLAPSSGSLNGGANSSANVHVTVGSIAAGTVVSGTLTISGPGATNSPRQVTVYLHVIAPPIVPLALQTNFDKGSYDPGNTMTITATLAQGANPVTDGMVQANYVAPDNSPHPLVLSNGGSGNAYTGTVPVGSVPGLGALYANASNPAGLTANDAHQVIVTGHNLYFSGNQTFPGTLYQNASGTVSVGVFNEAYVPEPTTIDLTDVTTSTVPLASLNVNVPGRTTGYYYLSFPGSGLSLGSHTLRAQLTRLPAGENPSSTTIVTGTVNVVEGRPQMKVEPLQPSLFVAAGGSVSQTVTVSNLGINSILRNVRVSLVHVTATAPYAWTSINAGLIGDLGENASSAFRLTAAPPLGTQPGAYQDYAIDVASDNGGTWRLPVTVFVDSNQHATVIFAVSDDAGQAVTSGQVRLVSSVALPSPWSDRTGSLDAHGVVTFTNVSVGILYNYQATAAGHDSANGTYSAQTEGRETVPVVLPVRAIQTTWTVVPTTIVDQYDINLTLTYEVNTPIPQLAVDPAQFVFSKDPANPAGPMLLNNSSATSGDMTVYNPSRITVGNVVVNTSSVSGASIQLTYGGATGTSVTIPSIPPLSSVVVHYDSYALCPLSGSPASNISATGVYTYFPVLPTLSMSENNWTVTGSALAGLTKNLDISNTGYKVATNVASSAPAHAWVHTPLALGSLGLGNTTAYNVVVSPPAGTAPGVYNEDLLITAGNGTPDNHLRLTITIGAGGSLTVVGVYQQGSAPALTAPIHTDVPVRVYTCTVPTPPIIIPTFSWGGGGGGLTISYGGAGGPGGGMIPPPNVPIPAPPTPMAHEVVKLQIPQTASLERQAFIATLETANTSGVDLNNFHVEMKVTDVGGSETNADGQRYVDLFAITTPTETGYTPPNHAIANGGTATSQWTLIPSSGLGGSNPAGTHYKIAAVYSYQMQDGTEFGLQQTVTTESVDITIFPMPQLLIDYYVPRDVKANHPVKLGVVVRNVGAGPAKNLTIVSGQPTIVENLSGLLITFGLLGGSVHGNPVPASNLTLNFGDVPAGGQTWGYWVLSADMDGQFTAFQATYTQRDYQGATLSPLIIAVHTHIIVQGDIVPAGGQSLQVVAPGPDVDPDALMDLQTGISTPMSTQYVTNAVLATTLVPTTTYALGSIGGWVLAVIPDPFPAIPLTSVRATYPDGTHAELNNGSGLVWRGRDPQGDKVYVVDTPRGALGQMTAYAIGYAMSGSPAASAGVSVNGNIGVRVDGVPLGRRCNPLTFNVIVDPAAMGVDVLVTNPSTSQTMNGVMVNMGGGLSWRYVMTVPCSWLGIVNVSFTIHRSSGPDTAAQASVELVDPSGYVYNALTGDRIPGATVTLHYFDPNTSLWVLPTPGGYPGRISPAVITQTTDALGVYGWNAAAGQYYVDVTATGFYTAASLAVTIPPAVTDLNVGLMPVPVPGPRLTVPLTQTVQYSDLLTFGMSTTDPDYAASMLRFAASGLASGLSLIDKLDGTAQITGTVQAPAGTYTATITATNSLGQTDAKPVAVIVIRESATLAYTGLAHVHAGTPITLSATLAQDADGYPGDITRARVIFDVISGTNTLTFGPLAPNSGGSVQTAGSALPSGLYTYTVRTDPANGYFLASPVTGTFTASNTTSTALTSAPNPSLVGQSVTFTATVASGGGVPAGSVTFKDGAATLGTGTLSGGKAIFSTTGLSLGTHNITAVYGGDSSFDGSTSAPRTQTVVSQNPTSVTLAGFTAATGTNAWSWGLPLGGFAALLGGAAVWRRRRRQ